MLRSRALVGLHLAVAITLAGCGGSSSDEDPDAPTAADADSSTDEATPTPSSATPDSADSDSADSDSAAPDTDPPDSTTMPGTAGEANETDLVVLVSNDDGVAAEGLDALVVALDGLDGVEVHVSAPPENQSGTSDRTTEGDLATAESETLSGFPALATEGFPADSVTVGLASLATPPDLVITGLNEGQNVGPLVELSGTVGAARTAARAGIPALATSQGLAAEPDYEAGVDVVLDWVEEFRSNRSADMPAEPSVTNINVPSCVSGGEVKGLLEVAVATDAAGRDAFTSDCSAAPGPPPTDDIGGVISGWATVSELEF